MSNQSACFETVFPISDDLTDTSIYGVTDTQGNDERGATRGASSKTISFAATQFEKTKREHERELGNTVKGWVADVEQRKRLLRAAAFKLMRSLDRGRQSSTRRVAVVN